MSTVRNTGVFFAKTEQHAYLFLRNEQEMIFKISIIDKMGTVPIAKDDIYVDGLDVSHFVHSVRESKMRCI